MKKTLLVLGAVVLVGLLWGGRRYNRFVSSSEGINGAWSQVQNQYQRRLDLVPNLVETVKGYAKHERETLESVISARARASEVVLTPEALKDPQALQRFQQIQGELSSALSRLMAVAENYPNLKANENFLQLQAQLEGTENRIAVERMRYNETVKAYNTSVQQFPGVLIARLFAFTPRAYFEAEPAAKAAPKVKF